MTCGKVRRLLSVRRECSGRERSAVDAHLASCQACQNVAREYEIMDRRLARLPEPVMATSVSPVIQARLIIQEQSGRTRPTSWGRQAVLAVAIVALVAFAVVASSHLSWRPSTLQTAMEPAEDTPPPQATGQIVASATSEPANITPSDVPTRMSEAASTPPFHGIQVHMLDQDPDPILQAMQELGFGWVKQQVRWSDVEPQRGDFRWERLDVVVANIDAAGLDLLLNVVDAPRWAWPGEADYEVMGPPGAPDDFAAFVGTLAARYQGRVGAYEIWQDQNTDWAWGGRVDAEEYVTLLQRAYVTIKQADPSARVISGGLTPSPGVSSGSESPSRYLRQMYDAGLSKACDAIGAHLPTWNLPPDASWESYEDPSARFRPPFETRDPSWSFRGTAEEYRRVMEAYDDDTRPLWVTEFGWAAAEVPPVHYAFAADNTLQEQAEFTVKAFEMARERGWVEAMFLWNLNFSVVTPESEKAMWSIVGSAWERSMTFGALAEMNK